MFRPGDAITNLRRWHRRAMTRQAGPYSTQLEYPQGVITEANPIVGSVDGRELCLVVGSDPKSGDVLVVSGTLFGWIASHDMTLVSRGK